MNSFKQNTGYKPRLSIEITDEQQQRINKLFGTYGIKRAVISILLDDLLDLIELHGQVVIGIILEGAAKPHKILPTLRSEERRVGKECRSRWSPYH